ncbi:MAG: Integral membrane protein CcmA [Elusimicrobia bacterium]|nr:MAG: Integral membrane protein CcmA [Elusimicrobiota bacterium]KAF0154321.1 MAG: Integral membrane protein CcmA [Elusimicrobiota bacterium]
MSIFKSGKGAFDATNPDTVFGREAYFQGTLTAKGSLKIDGRIDGSIVDAKMVTVGKTGRIKGDISCETCSVSGEVKGNILALAAIEVMSGARVEGDLRAPRIVLEEGAFFNGNCSMEPPAKDQPVRPQTQQEPAREKADRPAKS